MAQTIICDMCKAEEAVMMQSNMKTGETIAVGEQCMFPYFYTQAMELAPEGTFSAESEPEPEPPKTARKRATKTKTQPQPVDDVVPEGANPLDAKVEGYDTIEPMPF